MAKKVRKEKSQDLPPSLLPSDRILRGQIIEIANNKKLPIAQLELVGLSVRLINVLELNKSIIYLSELIALTSQDLVQIAGIDLNSIKSIKKAIADAPKVEMKKREFDKKESIDYKKYRFFQETGEDTTKRRSRYASQGGGGVVILRKLGLIKKKGA
jgi:DNA-directed RNA polymerase alpha subunit